MKWQYSAYDYHVLFKSKSIETVRITLMTADWKDTKLLFFSGLLIVPLSSSEPVTSLYSIIFSKNYCHIMSIPTSVVTATTAAIWYDDPVPAHGARAQHAARHHQKWKPVNKLSLVSLSNMHVAVDDVASVCVSVPRAIISQRMVCYLLQSPNRQTATSTLFMCVLAHTHERARAYIQQIECLYRIN